MNTQELVDRALSLYEARTEIDNELEELKEVLRKHAVEYATTDSNSVTLQGTSGHIVVTFQQATVRLQDASVVPEQYLETQTVQKLNKYGIQELLKSPIPGVVLSAPTARVGFRLNK